MQIERVVQSEFIGSHNLISQVIQVKSLSKLQRVSKDLQMMQKVSAHLLHMRETDASQARHQETSEILTRFLMDSRKS